MADASGEEVTSHTTDGPKMGLTTFTFRSQRYQIPSVIVKEQDPNDPSGEEQMCVMLDVGMFCPHCQGPCKEQLGTHGSAPLGRPEEGYHSLERQVHRRGHDRPGHDQQPPSRDVQSFKESLVQAMAEHSHSHADYSASEPFIRNVGHRSHTSHQQQHPQLPHQHHEETTGAGKVAVKQTFEQQHAPKDSPKFTVRHSVKQSSASYSTSSPGTKQKPIPKPRPSVKPKPQVSNEQPVSPTAHSMSPSDYGSMDRSPNEDIEDAPLPGVSNVIKKFSTSDYESMETQASPSPKARTPTSPRNKPEMWEDQRGAAKFLNNVPNTRLTEDNTNMLRAFGFEVISQSSKRKSQESTSSEVVSKVTKVENVPTESIPVRSAPDIPPRQRVTPVDDFLNITVSDDGNEEDIIEELLNDEEIPSEDSSARTGPTPEPRNKRAKSHHSDHYNYDQSSSDLLSDSEEDIIGLEKDILGDSFIGNLSEQPMLHEDSPEANYLHGGYRQHQDRRQKLSASPDDLDAGLSSGMDASECDTADESIRSISPEIDLDIALESAETEVFSGDATLGRVFSVRSEKRQYSLVKVYSKDKKKSRSRSSKPSSSSSMENIIEEKTAPKTSGVEREREKPTKASKEYSAPPQWPPHRQQSPETVFEDIVESLSDLGDGVGWTSDYESDQKDDLLSGGECVSPAQNGVVDTAVDNEINSLDFLGDSLNNRRTSSCECVVDHLTQDTESSYDHLGSSTGTREDGSADFSLDEYGTESDGSDPNVLEPGDKEAVVEIIDGTRSLTDKLFAVLDETEDKDKPVKEQNTVTKEKPQEEEIDEPPPVPKRTYLYCETSFVGDDKPSRPSSEEQANARSSNIPDMDKIYQELSEREKKRESPPKELLSHLRTTKKDKVEEQQMLYVYDEICAPTSPVIQRTPVYAKIQRLPQFLAEEYSHTLTNKGETMELESERMQAAQYRDYQQEIEKRIPDIEVSTAPLASEDDEVDTADIDMEFEHNLKVCSQRRGDEDVSSDLGSIMDGVEDQTSSREDICDADAPVCETDQIVPVTTKENAPPETIKHAYQAAKYVTKMVNNTSLATDKGEKPEEVETEVKKAPAVEDLTRESADVKSFSSKDSLTKKQAEQFIEQMMGNKLGKSKDSANTSFSKVCKTSNKQVVSKDEEVKSEEITTQEVTLVFSWPKKKGMPSFPKMGTPYREIFLHRVTRITDNDTEVIEGPTMETIEYGKSKGKISGVDYQKQKSIKAASIRKDTKSTQSITVDSSKQKECATQTDDLASPDSKLATDVDVHEVVIVSQDKNTTTVTTQTIPARIISTSQAEFSLGAIKSQAKSAGISMDATTTIHTENLVQSKERTGKTIEAVIVPEKQTGESVVHDELTTITTTTTSTVATTGANDPALPSDSVDQSDPSSRIRSDSSSSSFGSGSTGSVVDLRAAQQATLELDNPEMEEAEPSYQELEKQLVEQQLVPPQLSEAVSFSESRDVNKAKVQSDSQQGSVVEEFFHGPSEPAVVKPAFCEQYTRDEVTEQKSSESTDNKDLEGLIKGMPVVLPSESASDGKQDMEPPGEVSTDHIEIRNVTTQHIMQSLQRRMESLGYDIPLPDFGESEGSNSKEQHLDLIWTEEERRMLEEAVNSSEAQTVSEVKPKETYEIDASSFFSASNSVEVSRHETETETRTKVKDVPLLTKVRLIAYMSDAERELIKSLIEFCRIIEQIGEPKPSGRTLDVVPEGLELTVQPGVNYSDCLPSPESRKASQLHSPNSVSSDDHAAEKAFEDTLAVIEKTKQFVNETDFTKPGEPSRDSRTLDNDEDAHSAQCMDILDAEENPEDKSTTRRVSVSGLYRDLIDVVMPLKTEKSVITKSVSEVTTETRFVNEVTTENRAVSEVRTVEGSPREKHSKTSNVIYETSFVGNRTDVPLLAEGAAASGGPKGPVSERDNVSSVATVSTEYSVLHENAVAGSNCVEHAKDMSSVTAASAECSDICSPQSLSVEQSQTVVVTAPGQHPELRSKDRSQHHISRGGDMMVDVHANQSTGAEQQTDRVDGYAEQLSDEMMRAAILEMAKGTTVTETNSVTKITLLDRDNRKTVDVVEGGGSHAAAKKKQPPPPPPKRWKKKEQGRQPPPPPPKRWKKPQDDSKEVLSPIKPVFNGGGRVPPPVPPRRKYSEDTEEKIFLVRSDTGHRYEVEDVSSRHEPTRGRVEGSRRPFLGSDSSTEKVLLVGFNVQEEKDDDNMHHGSKVNQHLQKTENGECPSVTDEEKRGSLFYQSCSLKEQNEEPFGQISPLSPDEHSPFATTGHNRGSVEQNARPNIFLPASKDVSFADMLYAELVACKVMQDSMVEMENYVQNTQKSPVECEQEIESLTQTSRSKVLYSPHMGEELPPKLQVTESDQLEETKGSSENEQMSVTQGLPWTDSDLRGGPNGLQKKDSRTDEVDDTNHLQRKDLQRTDHGTNEVDETNDLQWKTSENKPADEAKNAETSQNHGTNGHGEGLQREDEDILKKDCRTEHYGEGNGFLRNHSETGSVDATSGFQGKDSDSDHIDEATGLQQTDQSGETGLKRKECETDHVSVEINGQQRDKSETDHYEENADFPMKASEVDPRDENKDYQANPSETYQVDETTALQKYDSESKPNHVVPVKNATSLTKTDHLCIKQRKGSETDQSSSDAETVVAAEDSNQVPTTEEESSDKSNTKDEETGSDESHADDEETPSDDELCIHARTPVQAIGDDGNAGNSPQPVQTAREIPQKADTKTSPLGESVKTVGDSDLSVHKEEDSTLEITTDAKFLLGQSIEMVADQHNLCQIRSDEPITSSKEKPEAAADLSPLEISIETERRYDPALTSSPMGGNISYNELIPMKDEAETSESELLSGSELSPSPPASSYSTFVKDSEVADELSSIPYDSTPDPDDILDPPEMPRLGGVDNTVEQKEDSDSSEESSADNSRPVVRLEVKSICDSSSATSDLYTSESSDSSPYPIGKPMRFTSELTSDYQDQAQPRMKLAEEMSGSMDLAIKPLAHIATQGMKELSFSESAVYDIKQLCGDPADGDHDALPYKPLYASAFQLRDDDDAAESRRFLKKKACDLRNIVEEQTEIEDKLSTIKENFTKLLADVGKMRKHSRETVERHRSWSADLTRLASESDEEEEQNRSTRTHRSRSCDNVKVNVNGSREFTALRKTQTQDDSEQEDPPKQPQPPSAKPKNRDIGMKIFSRVHSDPALHKRRPASAESYRSTSMRRDSNSSLDSSSLDSGSDTSERQPRRRMYSRRWSDYNISQEFLDRDQADRDDLVSYRGHLFPSPRQRGRSHNKSYQRSFYCQEEDQGVRDNRCEEGEKARLFKEWFYQRYKDQDKRLRIQKNPRK